MNIAQPGAFCEQARTDVLLCHVCRVAAGGVRWDYDPPVSDVLALCAAHSLTLREVLPSHYGVVARVTDATGTDLLLKAAQPQQHDCLGEAEALELWRGKGVVPRLVAVFEDGLHLREFIDGVALSDTATHARAAGALLSELHATEGTDAIPRAWMAVEAAALSQSAHLSAQQLRRAAELAATLLATPGSVIIHGDYYHKNILITEAGLRVIDPLARYDIPAADVASYVMTSAEAVDVTRAAMVAGYGAEPASLDAYIEWWALRNLHYRGAFEARGGGEWQPCYATAGDGVVWVG